MRVISGLYKGRILRTVSDYSVRPATGRVKQTLFDMLANRIDFDGARVLDLFAGSGSLGIEALSRGASHVTFVERDSRVSQFIEKNLALLGCQQDALIVQMDAQLYIQRAREHFDLVFADPPYEYEETSNLPGMIFEAGLVNDGGYVLIEHASTVSFSDTDAYRVGPQKRFGRTVVTFFRHQSRSNP